jgi:CheY-like chemotaxis protein
MSICAMIAPELPYLRRYARALSGSQANGDAYIVALLETLIEDPSLFDQSVGAKTALYKTFSSIWNAAPLNTVGGAPFAPADMRLEGVTSLSRQAFLLTAVEGFSADQAARVLDVDRATFSRLIDAAAREINAQAPTSVLIIEDEPVIALDLEQLVRNMGHSVVAHARTRDEALEMAKRHKPGLILSDIRLADGSSGLEAVRDILNASVDAPTIFITAFPGTFLTGERPEPAFMISKPYEEKVVRAVIGQALFLFEPGVKAKATAA